MVVIFMPFLPNLAVFLGISVWYLVPTYWIVVIYRFIESNLAIWQKNLEKAFLLFTTTHQLSILKFQYGETTSILYGAMLPFARLGIFSD